LFSAKKTAEGLKAKDSPKLKSLLTYGRGGEHGESNFQSLFGMPGTVFILTRGYLTQ